MRIATIKLLIDVESDAEACDFCSETFGTMPYIVDWAHARIPESPMDEATVPYDPPPQYVEGDFLGKRRPDYGRERRLDPHAPWSTIYQRAHDRLSVDPMGPETDRGGLIGQQPY